MILLDLSALSVSLTRNVSLLQIGGKNTWLIAFSVSATMALLIPSMGYLAGAYGVAVITVMNFASGLGQGPLFPGMAALQAQWIPNREFARAGSLVGCMWSGGQALMKVASPFIMVHFGWEWCYRCCGLHIFCWAIVCRKYFYSSPAEDPACTEAERAYISQGRKKETAPLVFDITAYWVVLRQVPVVALTTVNVLVGLGQSWYNWMPLCESSPISCSCSSSSSC